MDANKPIEDIEASLLAATKMALDKLVWWAHRDNECNAVWSTPSGHQITQSPDCPGEREDMPWVLTGLVLLIIIILAGSVGLFGGHAAS